MWLVNFQGYFKFQHFVFWDFPSTTVVKNPPAKAEDAKDMGLIPGLGRSPGEGNGNLF